MHLSLITAETIAKERQKDLLAEAARCHLSKAVGTGTLTNTPRWRDRLGDLLIRTGRRLKNGRHGRLQPDT